VSELAIGHQLLLHLKRTHRGRAATERVWSVRRVPSEGVTALFVHGVINRELGQPWASC
jgi:hypothetical protein